MTPTTSQPIAPPVETLPSADRVGRVESHGIDVIPANERHGRARELFTVWAAPNVSYLSLVVGGALVLMGLSLVQAIAVIVVGNLFSALMGLVAVSGPAAGAPSEVIMRAMFGVRGNRLNIAVSGWFVSVLYLALNWAAASITGFGLYERVFGAAPGTPAKIAIIVIIAAATLAISVYGHATIVRLYLPLTLVLTAVFVVLAWYVLGQVDWAYQPEVPLQGIDLWATVAAGIALVASAPLSYNNAADFARYLPAATSPLSIAAATALGAFIPSILFTVLGALAATAVDMSDPQAGLDAILPGWFGPLFLIAVILGTIANNAMTAYSSGLALQAVGIRLRRSRSVLLDGAVGVALTLYALLISDFLDSVSSMMQLIVALTGPVMAIYAADILWRRNRYDGSALADESPDSPFWYTAGFNLAGATALIVGATAAFLCLSTPVYTGPIAAALGGIDLSLPVGLLVPAVIYVAMMQSRQARS